MGPNIVSNSILSLYKQFLEGTQKEEGTRNRRKKIVNSTLHPISDL